MEAGSTAAADAMPTAVVGTTTGADKRGTLVSIVVVTIVSVAGSSRKTPSVVSRSPLGPANTKPPIATPPIAPTVAATRQLSRLASCFGLFDWSFEGVFVMICSCFGW